MRCVDLAELLKKTLIACCEINIQYECDLEILGSIHVRADQEEILNFLLNERVGVAPGNGVTIKRKQCEKSERRLSGERESPIKKQWCNRDEPITESASPAAEADVPVSKPPAEPEPEAEPKARGLFPRNKKTDQKADHHDNNKHNDSCAGEDSRRGHNAAGDAVTPECNNKHSEAIPLPPPAKPEASRSPKPDSKENKDTQQVPSGSPPPSTSSVASPKPYTVEEPDDVSDSGSGSEEKKSSSPSPASSSTPTSSYFTPVSNSNYWGLHRGQAPSATTFAAGSGIFHGTGIPQSMYGHVRPPVMQTSRVSRMMGPGMAVVEETTTVNGVTVGHKTMVGGVPGAHGVPVGAPGSAAANIKACNLCGRRFTSDACLNIHLRQDHGSMGSMMFQGSHMYSGKSANHGQKGSNFGQGQKGSNFGQGSGPKIYDCYVCGQKFYTQQTLFAHKDQVHK